MIVDTEMVKLTVAAAAAGQIRIFIISTNLIVTN